MAATHLAYNIMKMPGSKGVLTIKGDTKEAVTALRLAFKTAAAAQPTDASTLEAKETAPAKKKQLFTQDKIKMAMEDVEKTAFLTPCGVYCYTCMPFGLRNTGATFQWLMHIALGRQLGRNTEAYVDDIVVKSRKARTLIQDLEETFESLHRVNLRLNPEKCVFGVPSGKLLGFRVSHKGIEANPEKIKAIEDMSPPQTLMEMQKPAGRVTVLGRFISKLGERALPFFKLMKKKGPFEWTPEADWAFQDLKKYLTGPPVMVAPRSLEPLVLYLAATPYSASAALVAVREERQDKGAPHQARADAAQGREGAVELSVAEDQAQQGNIAEAPEDGQVSGNPPPQDMPQSPQDPSLNSVPALVEHPVYFVSTVLRDARARYPMPQKLLLALLLEFSTTRVIKGAALADFVAEWTDAPALEEGEDRSTSPGSEAPDGWVVYFDGAFAHQGAGAGAVLISPTQDKLYYAAQLYFQHGEKVSNNIAEYEGLIAGLKAAAALGVRRLTIKGDSQLLVNFSNKVYEPKDEHMEAYLAEVRKMEK
ncbi:unnamed protein product [Triticum aestivum]|uniref:RNase H type-1 domain-containing protein n=1 Tax=Triticum aestivum TaxID=4565 RepID=A0A7H4LLA6_WHEAT|nr:unnamed protein product [Triticum aestivum]